MSMRKTARVRAAASAALLAAAVGGCGGRPAVTARPEQPAAAPVTALTSAPSPVVPPRDPGFDYADPGQVCARFVAAVYSADTTRDTGPGDAFTRASAYTTGALAGQRAAASRDGRWDTWLLHRARLTAVVTPHTGMHPEPDSSVDARRAVLVTATPVGGDGWRGWTERAIVHCTLRAGAPGWRVDHYTVELAPS